MYSVFGQHHTVRTRGTGNLELARHRADKCGQRVASTTTRRPLAC
jgi:hypothetical protein